MLEIKITDFRDYIYSDLVEYLNIQNQVHFKIVLPKKFIAPNDRSYVFWDYYTALYAGEKLFGLSEHFAYYIPCPYTRNDFFFEIACTNMKELAEIIQHIKFGYHERSGHDFNFFHDLASDFFIAVAGDQVKPKCEGFMPLIAEYIGKDDNP